MSNLQKLQPHQKMVYEFNNQAKNFAGYLKKISDNDLDIVGYYNDICNLCNYDVLNDMVVEQYIIHVLPYKKQIYDADEDFFMNLDFKKEYDFDHQQMLQSMKIKDIWAKNKGNKKVKNTVIDYFTLLTHTAEEYQKTMRQ